MLTALAAVAVVLLVVLLPQLIFDIGFRPTIRRLAFRNVVRRPSEAALVVAGSMLATALITASLIIGDSFGASVRGQVSTVYGPIDLIVPSETPTEARETLASADVDGIFDGLLVARYGGVAIGGVDDNANVVGDARLLEIDVGAAQEFGADPAATGLAGLPAELSGDEVIINDRLSERLGVRVGDSVRVFTEQGDRRLTVVSIGERRGLVGFGEVIASPGTVTASLVEGATTPAVFISNQGDDEGGAELTDDARALVVGALGSETSVFEVKQNLLDEADFDARYMTDLFSTIGGFSVVAGILLLINLFVMLAGERRRELGTLQALGLDRSVLRRVFTLEGFLYSLLAAVCGAGLGVAVAAVVMRFARDISDTGSDLRVGLAVEPLSLLTGAAIGLAVSQLTVSVTSAQITRMNIVSALKDLSDAGRVDRGLFWPIVGSIVVVVSDVAMLAFYDVPLVVLLGPAGCIMGITPLLSRFIPLRVAAAILALIGLIVTGAALSLWSDVLDNPDLSFFLVQGVLMVGLGVVFTMSLDRVWAGAAERVRPGSPALRVGLAHPLERPARTGLLVAMFALVIFTVTFMAVLNTVFQRQVPQFARQIGGGFDLVVDSSPTNPFTVSDLEANPDIDSALPILQADLEYTYVDSDGDTIEDFWFSSTLAGDFPVDRGPELRDRQPVFTSDADAWAAVAASDIAAPVVIVPVSSGFSPGDQLTAVRRNGETTGVTIAGTTELNYTIGSGFYVPDDLGPWLTDGVGVVSRHYVIVSDGAEPDRVVAELNSELVRGAQAQTFITAAQADVDEQQAFIRLLQGYLALGLLIGVAGLAVVLIRAVRERRRQLGVMSAIGVQRASLRNMFVIESAFIGLQGVVLGVGLGLVSAWLVITRSDAFAADLGFAVPVVGVATLAVVALVAAIMAGVVPARRASRVPPVVALRMTG